MMVVRPKRRAPMRTSTVAMLVVLGLAGWQVQGTLNADAAHPVRTAYQDTVQRYQEGQTVQRATSPQRTQPLAEGGNASGVDNARLAEGGNATGVETKYRLAEGANATGVDNARLA